MGTHFERRYVTCRQKRVRKTSIISDIPILLRFVYLPVQKKSGCNKPLIIETYKASTSSLLRPVVSTINSIDMPFSFIFLAISFLPSAKPSLFAFGKTFFATNLLSSPVNGFLIHYSLLTKLCNVTHFSILTYSIKLISSSF